MKEANRQKNVPANEDSVRDIAYSLENASSGSDYRALEGLAQQFGFTHFMVARMPRSDTAAFLHVLALANWPASLVDAYDAAGLFSSSLLARALTQTRLPVFNEGCLLAEGWSGQGGHTAHNEEIAELFSAAGMCTTLGIHLSNRDGESFFLVLSGTRSALSSVEITDFTYESLRIFDMMEQNSTVNDMLKDQLSVREIECLRLAADGKSSDDIAVCLGVSTLAVSSYFKSASEKLFAVNRLQAVARAARMKLI